MKRKRRLRAVVGIAWVGYLMTAISPGTAQAEGGASQWQSLNLAALATTPTVPISYQPDGIDIYSTQPSDDGDNHYIHVAEQGGVYFPKYCKGGLPLSLAEKGAHPVTRDCPTAMGRASGYTWAEINNEFESNERSYLWSTVDEVFTTAVSSAAIFVVVGALDVLSDGADTPLDPPEIIALRRGVAALAGESSEAAIKTRTILELALQDSAKTGSGAVAKTRVAKLMENLRSANTRKSLIKAALASGATTVLNTGADTFGNWAFSNHITSNDSSPTEIRAASKEVQEALLHPTHCVSFVASPIQSFTAEVDAILGQIQ